MTAKNRSKVLDPERFEELRAWRKKRRRSRLGWLLTVGLLLLGLLLGGAFVVSVVFFLWVLGRHPQELGLHVFAGGLSLGTLALTAWVFLLSLYTGYTSKKSEGEALESRHIYRKVSQAQQGSLSVAEGATRSGELTLAQEDGALSLSEHEVSEATVLFEPSSDREPTPARDPLEEPTRQGVPHASASRS